MSAPANDTETTADKPGLDSAFVSEITAKLGALPDGWVVDLAMMRADHTGGFSLWFRNNNPALGALGRAFAIPADHVAQHGWLWAQREVAAELELSLIRHLRSLVPAEEAL